MDAQLRELLSEEDYEDARESSLTAFYTPSEISDAILASLVSIGLGQADAADQVLDPSAGTGAFERGVFEGLNAEAQMIEIDPITARIAQHLHGTAVTNAGYQDVDIEPGSFDAAISNVPFTNSIQLDYKGDKKSIHNYFLEKMLDDVKGGGIVTVIVSSYFMDGKSRAARESIYGKADLVAAVRLPSTAFAGAGTDVVSDVLVFRKRRAGEQPLGAGWLEAVDIPQAEIPDGLEGGVSVNRVFRERPELVIGTPKVVSGRFGPALTVEGEDDIAKIAGAMATHLVTSLSSSLGFRFDFHNALDAYDGKAHVRVRPKGIVDNADYVISADGSIWMESGGAFEEVETPDLATRERLKGLVALAKEANALIDIEASSSDDARVDEAIASLNEHYDAFVERFGHVNSRANRSVYGNSAPSRVRLLGLERVGPRGDYIGKADILTKRIAQPSPQRPTHADTPQEAIGISLNEFNRIDLPRIAELLDTSEADVLDVLGDSIVIDPDTGRACEAGDYLSGDVRSKLDHVRELIRAETVAHELEDLSAWQKEAGIHEALHISGIDDREHSYAYHQGIGLKAELAQTPAWNALVNGPDATGAVDVGAAIGHVDNSGRKIAAHIWLDELAHEPVMPRISSALTNDNDAHEEPYPGYQLLTGMNLCSSDFGGQRNWRDRGEGVHPDPLLMDRVADTGAALICHALSNPHIPDAYLAAYIDADKPARWRDDSVSYIDIAGALLGFDREASGSDIVKALRAEPAAAEFILVETKRVFAIPDNGASYSSGMFYNRSREILGNVLEPGRFEQFKSKRDRFLEARKAQRPDNSVRIADLLKLEQRLADALPKQLDQEQIAITLASPVLSPSDIIAFAKEHIAESWTSEAVASKLAVTVDSETGHYTLTYGGASTSAQASAKYGIAKEGDSNGLTPYRLLDTLVKNGSPDVTRSVVGADGKTKTERDPEKSLQAREKRLQMEQDFREWVWKDPARAKRLVDRYNMKFNRYKPKEVDGSYLDLPGSAPDIELKPHQKSAVARVLQSDEGTLLAHVVGSGKTFEGIASVHEAKRLGKCSKPMVSVPNGLVGQWASEWMRLYPQDKILVMDDNATKSVDAQQNFWGLVQTGDWDAVIVPASRFDAMTLSPDVLDKMAEQQDEDLLAKLDMAYRSGLLTTKKYSERKLAIETKQNKRKSKVKNQRESEKKTLTYFDELGVDFLFVDEAHRYKNLGIETTSIKAQGVNRSSSNRAKHMLMRLDWMREKGLGGNIVFATGTPVTNSLCELWVMERFLSPSLLKASGCLEFDNWAGMFGRITFEPEVGVDGTFKPKDRLSKFANIGELVSVLHCFGDVITNDDIDLVLPKVEVKSEVVKPTKLQSFLMKWLVARGERIHANAVEATVDNMLKLTSDGKAIALDPKLLFSDDPDVKAMDHGKVNVCAKNIHDVYVRTATDPDGKPLLGTQLVFCDTSADNGTHAFNIPADLKRRLVGLGIPESEIATVSGALKPEARERLFADVRAGKIRVLMGSTEVLGTGVSVQERLAAIHDLDCPWKSADLEQRMGRIQRQGNGFADCKWFTPKCYRYSVEGSFDAFLYQTAERKAKFIAQVLTNKAPARELDDMDEVVLKLSEMKAATTGNPELRRRMELENRIASALILKDGFVQNRAAQKNQLETKLIPQIETLEGRCSDLGALNPYCQKVQPDTWNALNVGGTVYAAAKDATLAANEALWSARLSADTNGTVVGSVGGMDIGIQRVVDQGGLSLSYLYLETDGHRIKAPSPMSDPSSNGVKAVTQLKELVGRVPRGLESSTAKLAEKRAAREAAEAELAKPWPGEADLERDKAELALLPPITQAAESSIAYPTEFIAQLLRGEFGEIDAVIDDLEVGIKPEARAVNRKDDAPYIIDATCVVYDMFDAIDTTIQGFPSDSGETLDTTPPAQSPAPVERRVGIKIDTLDCGFFGNAADNDDLFRPGDARAASAEALKMMCQDDREEPKPDKHHCTDAEDMGDGTGPGL